MKSTSVQPYDTCFFSSINSGSTQSAREVVPVLLELVKPHSVIDVGCGEGAWLSAFLEHGVARIQGVDGEWVHRSRLLIPQASFSQCDLKSPISLNEKYDLVLSLEVAEHLPRESAETFVDSLVGLGNIIVFSAAVPFQGGANHLNEQWPEFWVDLFAQRGYRVVDCLRKRLWKQTRIAWWYRQNMLLFVRESCVPDYPHLDGASAGGQLSVIHPESYLRKCDLENKLSGRSAVKLLTRIIIKALVARLSDFFSFCAKRQPEANEGAGPS